MVEADARHTGDHVFARLFAHVKRRSTYLLETWRHGEEEETIETETTGYQLRLRNQSGNPLTVCNVRAGDGIRGESTYRCKQNSDAPPRLRSRVSRHAPTPKSRTGRACTIEAKPTTTTHHRHAKPRTAQRLLRHILKANNGLPAR